MNEEKKEKNSKDVENLNEEKDSCGCGEENEGKCCREKVDTKESGCCGGGCCGA